MLMRSLIVLSLSATITACGGSLANMENAELSAKRDDCIRQKPSSPGRVTACENIREECERRRKDGNFAC